jgi:hypothetical protein
MKMYYVITDNRVIEGRNIKDIKKQVDLEEKDFKKVGTDRVIIMTKEQLDFVADRKALSKIPIEKLYKKSNNDLLLYIIAILSFLALIK